MVVGLDFYTTSPPSLHSFRSVIRTGNALNGGTFHPKLYMFENAGGFCCIMESSNFTSGGFGDNAELNVCVEGGKSDPFFRQVSALGIAFSQAEPRAGECVPCAREISWIGSSPEILHQHNVGFFEFVLDIDN
jgi:hypothetical protein